MTIFLEYTIFGNTIYDYAIALGIFLIVYILILIFKKVILKKAIILAEKTESKRGNIIIRNISSISKLFYIVLSIYIPLQYINVNASLDRIAKIGFLAIFLREISSITIKTIKYVLEKTINDKHNGKKDTTKINLFYMIAKIFVYIIGGLLLLSNIGIEITPLIASLGVAGIGVAFALQKILGDVFSSFTIYLDKPFEIGDFIVIGEDSGHIKDIGIKSTRIETLQGQELIIPNAEITGIRINNYGKMKKRRVVFSIGVVYQTSPEKLEKIPSYIQKIIENLEHTEFDRAHFIEFGKSELIFEIVYYITTKDFQIYRDTHQTISLEIMKIFKNQQIGFAYPTQSIYIENAK